MKRLFDQIVRALDDPNEQASPGQLATILSTVQQLSQSYNANPSAVQSALSIVGSFVRSGLQEKRSTQGQQQAQEIVNHYSGTYPNPQAVNALFNSSQVQQIVQTVAQRTGLDAQMIVQMLPILVPLVLNLLQTGTNTQNPQQASNPVLNTFLDANGDGEVDVADALSLVGRFLSR